MIVLGASSESINVIRQFVADQGVTFPILHDRGGVLRGKYRLSNALSPYPRDYIIDRQGVFRYTSTEYDPQTMVRVIQSLLSGANVAAGDEFENLPAHYLLAQNYPNPFNGSTLFSFDLPAETYVDFAIYNLAGQKVAQLVNATLPPGRRRLRWDGRDDDGAALPSGVYFYHLRTPSVIMTQKLSIVR